MGVTAKKMLSMVAPGALLVGVGVLGIPTSTSAASCNVTSYVNPAKTYSESKLISGPCVYSRAYVSRINTGNGQVSWSYGKYAYTNEWSVASNGSYMPRTAGYDTY
ncbi:hypothetical protein SAMN06298212_1086 [Ruaniaceae bacterium KH17]|nr:hypothetical protein SAMN06298212_1086 [Ruaniaceae bacterium KH17]